MAKGKEKSGKYKTQKIGTIEPYEYSVRLKTAKDRRALINRIKRTIRSSMEYRDYVQFLRDYMNMNRCSFFKNITSEGAENRKIKIEIHHEPFTLEDYVETVLTKYIENGIPINELYIADEVMELHFKNQVGLVPLSKTLHQVVHNSNKIKIPLYRIYGNYSSFIEEYGDYISDEMMEKLERKIDETKAISETSFESIDAEYTYVEYDGFILPQKITEEEPAIA